MSKRLFMPLLLAAAILMGADGLGAQPLKRNATDGKGRKQGLWVKTTDDGTPVYEGSFVDDKPVGVWKRYHPNGKLMAELVYGGGDTCRATLYTEEGGLMARGTYLGQRKAGLWLGYDDEGRLSGRQHYANGLQDGVEEVLGPGGRVLEAIEWRKGVREGVSKAYDVDGALLYEGRFVNDRPDGLCTYYHPSGRVRLQGVYSEGLREGEWKSFSKAGVLTGTTLYVKGVPMNNDEQVVKESRQIDLLNKQKGRFDEPEPDF